MNILKCREKVLKLSNNNRNNDDILVLVDDTEQGLQDNLDYILTEKVVVEEKTKSVHPPRQVRYVDCRNLEVEDLLLRGYQTRVNDVVLEE